MEKNKKTLIILGLVGVGLYFLLRKKTAPTTTAVTTPSTGKDISVVETPVYSSTPIYTAPVVETPVYSTNPVYTAPLTEVIKTLADSVYIGEPVVITKVAPNTPYDTTGDVIIEESTSGGGGGGLTMNKEILEYYK